MQAKDVPKLTKDWILISEAARRLGRSKPYVNKQIFDVETLVSVRCLGEGAERIYVLSVDEVDAFAAKLRQEEADRGYAKDLSARRARIKTWGIANGYQVSKYGYPSTVLCDAYDQAHPEDFAAPE